MGKASVTALLQTTGWRWKTGINIESVLFLASRGVLEPLPETGTSWPHHEGMKFGLCFWQWLCIRQRRPKEKSWRCPLWYSVAPRRRSKDRGRLEIKSLAPVSHTPNLTTNPQFDVCFLQLELGRKLTTKDF